MRRYGFVLAVIALLAPSLAHSQAQQANSMSNASAPPTDAVEARTDDNSIAGAAPKSRSLMGMVMDVLIASAEQQSARQQTQSGRATPKVTRAKAAPVASPALKPPSSDLATREQVAVESKP